MSLEREEGRKILVYTLTKYGPILKNISVVNKSEEENRYGEETLTVGRHPKADLQILSPYSQKLYVINFPLGIVLLLLCLCFFFNWILFWVFVIRCSWFGSGHETCVSEKKLEAKVPLELNEVSPLEYSYFFCWFCLNCTCN